MPRIYPISVFARLYRLILANTELSEEAALELVYLLNTAHLDTCREKYKIEPFESSREKFYRMVLRQAPDLTGESYYELLEQMVCGINRAYITEDQRDARQYLCNQMRDIEYRAELAGVSECDYSQGAVPSSQCKTSCATSYSEAMI